MKEFKVSHGKNGWIIRVDNYKFYAEDYLYLFGFLTTEKYTKEQIEEMVKKRLSYAETRSYD